MSKYKVGDYDIELLHKEMLKIMCKIDMICRKHNIHYILFGGTMLGAVRHGGFIPWDDDADLAMPREDYDRFVEIANTELPEGYRFECYENTEEYPYNFGKVRSVNTVFREKFTGKLNINHGVYVDIFPMDYADVDFAKRGKFIGRLTAIKYYKLGIIKGKKYLPFSVLGVKTINKMISKALRYHYGIGDGYCQLCLRGPKDVIVPRSLFTDVIDIPFENYKFFIPKEYDAYLTSKYGDYMQLPPIEDQRPGHVIEEVRL